MSNFKPPLGVPPHQIGSKKRIADLIDALFSYNKSYWSGGLHIDDQNLLANIKRFACEIMGICDLELMLNNYDFYNLQFNDKDLNKLSSTSNTDSDSKIDTEKSINKLISEIEKYKNKDLHGDLDDIFTIDVMRLFEYILKINSDPSFDPTEYISTRPPFEVFNTVMKMLNMHNKYVMQDTLFGSTIIDMDSIDENIEEDTEEEPTLDNLRNIICKYKDIMMNKLDNLKFKDEVSDIFIWILESNTDVGEKENNMISYLNNKDKAISANIFNYCMELSGLNFVMAKPDRSTYLIMEKGGR